MSTLPFRCVDLPAPQQRAAEPTAPRFRHPSYPATYNLARRAYVQAFGEHSWARYRKNSPTHPLPRPSVRQWFELCCWARLHTDVAPYWH